MHDDLVLDYVKQLTELNIYCEIVDHPANRAILDVVESLRLTVADSLPTLIMKADGQDLAVVLRGDFRADFKKIKKEFKFKDLRMATPEEFTSLTGLLVGAARVYTPNVRSIIDKRVFETEYLIGGSGSFSCSIKYKTADLVNIPNHVVADVVREG